jgi:hypothetical protein
MSDEVWACLTGIEAPAVVEQRGPLSLEDVADYTLQAGEAIAEAHGLGIVHPRPLDHWFRRAHRAHLL